jgi:hypothetical protein
LRRGIGAWPTAGSLIRPSAIATTGIKRIFGIAGISGRNGIMGIGLVRGMSGQGFETGNWIIWGFMVIFGGFVMHIRRLWVPIAKNSNPDFAVPTA